MRSFLDFIYKAGLWLAIFAMLAIAGMVFLQICGRILDRALLAIGQPAVGFAIPSLTEFGGFLFVAATFLALPATLRSGGHVRVTFIGNVMPVRIARWIEGVVILAAIMLASFAAWHSALQVADSWKFNSLSYGVIPVPLWLPQTAMTLGLVLFAVALADELFQLLKGRTPSYRVAEEARAQSGEGE